MVRLLELAYGVCVRARELAGPRRAQLMFVVLAAVAVAVGFGAPRLGPGDGLAGSIPAASSEAIGSSARAGPGEFERAKPAPVPEEAPDPGPPRTSCGAVVHVGDSTSEGLISADYLPHARDRIEAQYARYGAARSRMEIEGATSVVESLDGTNAYDAASTVIDNGYRGCWVIALGTNDTADVDAGSAVGLPERIDRMMSVIGNRPVLWLTVRSLLGGGPYSAQNMEAFNHALLAACDEYPNLRVFDWASVVKDEWFIDDGIHFTSAGYAARAHRTARALAQAFPAQGSSGSCVVG